MAKQGLLATIRDRIASGDCRYRRTVFRDTSSSLAISRIEWPAPFISYISFT